MSGVVTPPNYNKAQTDLNLQDTLLAWKRAIFLELNCHGIATVTKVDTVRQVLTATMNYSKTYYQENTAGQMVPITSAYAVLVDCPFLVLGGGGASLTFPIAAGDECVILFNDRDLDNWFAGAPAGGAVASNRLHSFSDGMALVGFPVGPVFDPARALLQYGPTGAGVGVSASKVKIFNQLTTLNTLLQNLSTQLENLAAACAAITVTGVTAGAGVSGVPVNAASFTTVSSQISTIATQIGGLLE